MNLLAACSVNSWVPNFRTNGTTQELLFGIKRIDFRLQIRRITPGKFGHGIDAGSFEQPRIRRADTLPELCHFLKIRGCQKLSHYFIID
jgi:hypothetical protein